jgi:HME family heavy-metal exporter
VAHVPRKRISEEVPSVDIEVEQPLAHLISHMVSGVYAQIAIKIHGDDLNTLLTLADQVKRSIADVEGVTPPVVEPVQMTPELHIRLRGEDLAMHGFTARSSYRAANSPSRPSGFGGVGRSAAV